MALSGVLAGAIAVSEVFQRARGSSVAATRAVGVSLWRPDVDWRGDTASGPPLKYLPSNLWLPGLGHLGQAYAWSLGFLPFADADRASVRIMLQDVDEVVEANESTSTLVTPGERGLKARLVGQRLDALGFETRLTERLSIDTRSGRRASHASHWRAFTALTPDDSWKAPASTSLSTAGSGQRLRTTSESGSTDSHHRDRPSRLRPARRRFS